MKNILAVLFIGTVIITNIPACAAEQIAKENMPAGENFGQEHKKGEKFANYHVYDSRQNAMQNIDMALEKSRKNGHKLMVVLGANWCPDSRGFAARMAEPEFAKLVEDNYEIVYVSTGDKLGDKTGNSEVSARFGMDNIVGTPTVYIISNGAVLNKHSAGYWRDLRKIPEDVTYAYLDHYANK